MCVARRIDTAESTTHMFRTHICVTNSYVSRTAGGLLERSGGGALICHVLTYVSRTDIHVTNSHMCHELQVVYSSAAAEGLTAAESTTGKKVRDLLTRCVAVCCRMLQCVAVCCSML